MTIRKKIFRLQYLLIPPVICSLSMGCVSKFKRYSNEIEIKEDKINELEEEKNKLLHEVEILRNEEVETNRIRGVAEESLSGTGINVTVKEDGVVSLTLPSSSYFAPGKASLKQEAKSNLKKISLLLNQQFYNNTIRIEGHTDNQPIKKKKDKYRTNWELSAARAISVLFYLTKECGVSPGKMYIAGFGEYDPIASNSTKTGRNQNRRVEIVIIP